MDFSSAGKKKDWFLILTLFFLWQCVDIEFADPSEVAEVNEQNCFNSSDISFELVFSTSALTSAASPSFSSTPFSTLLLLATIPLMTMTMMTAGSLGLLS